jgi:hypothetical protein
MPRLLQDGTDSIKKKRKVFIELGGWFSHFAGVHGMHWK